MTLGLFIVRLQRSYVMKAGNTAKTLLIFASVFCAQTASAQYVGPSGVETYKTVADILRNPVDDAQVVLSGYLIRKIGKEKYIFSDGVSEMTVDIDDKYFPATPVSEKTKVQIRGEIDKDLLRSPEVEVDFVSVLKE